MREIKSLSIVAPVYNEEQVIGQFIEQVLSETKKLSDIRTKIVLVVDRSSDRTLEVALGRQNEIDNIVIIELSSRFGQQPSLLAGIAESLDSDVVITMDSDLQHPPSKIHELIKEFLNGADVVQAIRTNTDRISPLRKFFGNRYYSVISFLSDKLVDRNSSDFRLISKDVAKILIQEFPESEVFLRGVIPLMGFERRFIYFAAPKRPAGYSKYSLSRLLKFAISGIVSFSSKPLRLSLHLGMAYAILSFFFIIYLVVNFLFEKNTPSGWTTTLVVVLLSNTLVFLVLGIIGTYLATVFDEVKRRPKFIIRKKHTYEKISGRGGSH